MGIIEKAMEVFGVKRALVWRPYPPEVEGEEVFVARRKTTVFWVKREAHEATWSLIVTDEDADPLDLRTNLADKARAMAAADEWVVENE